MRKSRIFKVDKEDIQQDLDLTPILSLMIVLIPMMLLSTAFVRLMMIESPLPQFISEAVAQSSDGEEQVSIDVMIYGDRSSQIVLNVNGRKAEQRLSAGMNGDSPGVDLSSLRSELIKIKKRHPMTFEISLHPSPEVTFEEIVKVMDWARETGDSAVTFEVINKETGEKTTTNLLFPEVAFGNLAEG